MNCSKCGFALAEGTNYCPQCGTPVGVGGSAQRGGERRQLTLLWADLVRSTSLAEQWDAEVIGKLYSAYLECCSDVVRRYEGRVDSQFGDGILALFGHPAAHEDDAIRAVRSGLELVERIPTLDWAGEPPQVRVAIHTGTVVVGDLGSEPLARRMVLGEVPNIVERLKEQADPDTVVISELTWRLVTGYFEFEDRGAKHLRSISRPVRVFRVLESSSISTRFDAVASTGLSPLTGRAIEIETIRRLWREVEEGSGRTLLLSGEPGIGKSRLLGVARESAAEGGARLLSVQCSPYHTDSELHPIEELLSRLVFEGGKISPAEDLQRIRCYIEGRGIRSELALPLLARLLSVPMGSEDPLAGRPTVPLRQYTLELLTEILLPAHGSEVIFLSIEDIHWADPTTRELISLLAVRASTVPAMLVLTSRGTAGELRLPPEKLTALHVAALPRAATRELVTQVAGSRLPEQVVQEILDRSGGVPLFIEAVTRTVLESGFLENRGDHHALVAPLPRGIIPVTLRDSLMARVDSLGPHRPLAQLAATIGREFGVELLERTWSILGKPASEKVRPEVLDALDHMLQLDLISPKDPSTRESFEFSHALVQEVAYESLLRSTRQEFHGAIAEILSRDFPETVNSAPELLARHYEGGGNDDEAIDYWLAAGLSAQERSAERECVAYLSRAVSLLRSQSEEDPRRVEREMVAQRALAPALMVTHGWAAREVEEACIRTRGFPARERGGLLEADAG